MYIEHIAYVTHKFCIKACGSWSYLTGLRTNVLCIGSVLGFSVNFELVQTVHVRGECIFTIARSNAVNCFTRSLNERCDNMWA